MSIESEIEKIVEEMLMKSDLDIKSDLNNKITQLTIELMEIIDKKISEQVIKHFRFLANSLILKLKEE